jgi:hypothetical protein
MTAKVWQGMPCGCLSVTVALAKVTYIIRKFQIKSGENK